MHLQESPRASCELLYFVHEAFYFHLCMYLCMYDCEALLPLLSFGKMGPKCIHACTHVFVCERLLTLVRKGACLCACVRPCTLLCMHGMFDCKNTHSHMCLCAELLASMRERVCSIPLNFM